MKTPKVPLAATLLAALGVAVLFGLGTWQIQRLAWKTELIARIEAGLAEPAAQLPTDPIDPAGLDYRRVFVTGIFDHAHEFHFASRVHDGEAGWHVMTPLERTDGGRPDWIIVDRGWVPEGRRNPSSRADNLPTGEVRVEGILRAPTPPGWMRPDNDPARNVWFSVDLDRMAGTAGLARDSLVPMILEAGATPAGGPAYPIGGLARIELKNDHLSYALTWYALGLALAVIYWIRRRQILAGSDRPPEPERNL